MKSSSRRPGRIAAAALAVGGMTIGGFFAGNAIAAERTDSPEQVPGLSATPGGNAPEGKAPTFPVNARGLTYGSSEGVALENMPDLQLVKVGNGQLGYVETDLLNEITGANVASPEEAIAWQKQMNSESWKTKQVPVYLQDGVTKVGSFEISRSQGTSTRE